MPLFRNSLDAGIQDSKHKYLDNGQIWITITGEEEGNGDESDKGIKARDRRYSC